MVHAFERAGYKLALDTGSGAVHVLDDAAFEILECMEESDIKTNEEPVFQKHLTSRFDEEMLLSAYKELKALIKQGLLFSDDSYSEFKNMLGDAPVKAMCLHIAHDCNLRCKYCFASTGDFGKGRKLMDFETAKSAIDLLVQISENRRNLEVDFFGGEPLMNFDVVKKTVSYARSIEEKHGKHFRFTLTTNGVSLNSDISDYVNKEMDNVVLSIDGRKEVNDNMRVRINGTGSYDTIVPKFQELVSKRAGKEYYVRGTYTKNNLDFDKDVLELYRLGFDQISVEPVVGPETDDYAIQNKDIAEIEKSYERLMDELIERRNNQKGNFNFFHFMIDLDNGPCAIKRLKGCGSGNEYVAVTPDGEIYPCHQFAGQSEFLMGTVNEGLTNTMLKTEFANANVLNKEECNGCWAKFYCSGGCNANNYSFNKSLNITHKISCELEKIRLECAIALKASELI